MHISIKNRLNISLIIFHGNSGRRGVFCLENPDRKGGGGSCASGNPGERGVKK